MLPGLSFAPGESTSAEAARVLGLPISCNESSPLSFALVVAFARCKFRLDLPSVCLILQATIVGNAAHFRASQLSDRTFKFFVSSRQIGFFIVNRRSFSCSLYKLSFHLWGNGGPDWKREYAFFYAEEALSWKFISRTKSPAQRFPPSRLASKSGPSHAHGGRSSTAPRSFARPGLSFADAVRSKSSLDVLPTYVNTEPSGASARPHLPVQTPSLFRLNVLCSEGCNLR